MVIQSMFRKFEEKIKLKRFDENAELREKRDHILKRLRDNIPNAFEWFSQGSYAMETGVQPLNGDYDIDVGVVFNVERVTHDPVTVKGWVHKALESHTTRVEWRRPCVTVYYQQSGETVYHVDLAILVKEPYAGSMYLAIGKEHSAKEQREWQPDDRKGFIVAVEQRFLGEDAAQFRRVIRYLKRWRDVHFASEGRAAPTGLGLTVAAYHWFQPTKTGSYYDPTYDDLGATASLVQVIRQGFKRTWDQRLGNHVHRLSLRFPCAPHDDVFERMTNQQMQEFYQRLEKLSGWLEEARRTGSVTPLRAAFGTDFPEK
ncbi:cyclic GMP-AMP synthase DncV-like nucleotidyltransferase [Sorangium sp. So ce291]|uniref:cyclic GMP-AMP synthase DncV-like nucleotidyltransferase n=1 Tax=Sorangium sp. So ce291 TaxID=3133294 RepID=UPI003F5DFF1A